jgi:hypothetical protein
MSTPKYQTHYTRLLAGLENSRWDYMLVLADWAEEEGNTTLARGWRWLADKHRWPGQTTRTEDRRTIPYHYWQPSPRFDEDTHFECVLPGPIIRLMRRRKQITYYERRVMCESRRVLFELTAQVVGRWLSSKKEG